MVGEACRADFCNNPLGYEKDNPMEKLEDTKRTALSGYMTSIFSDRPYRILVKVLGADLRNPIIFEPNWIKAVQERNQW